MNDELQLAISKIEGGVSTLLGRVSALEAAHKSDRQKVLDDLDRSDKEVKKAIADLTDIKNKSNATFDDVMKRMDKVQRAVALNARSSFRDPIKRACADEATTAWLNAAARFIHHLSKGANPNDTPASMRKLVEEANAKAKSLTGVDSGLGQATVPQETFDVIYDTFLEYGQWSTLGVQRVGMRTTILPVATARPTAYWIGSQTGGQGEGSAITQGNFTGGSVTLVIQTIAAYVAVARELLADSTVDLAPYVLREMVQAVAYGLDYAAFQGNGASDQVSAGYNGIFNAGAVNTQLAATAAQGNTTFSLLQLEDFVLALTTVSPEVLMRDAKWWAHPQVIASAVLIRDKQGRPLFQTWMERPDVKSIGSILGYPVQMAGAAPTTALTTAGSPAMVFGDPEGQVIGIRQDLELATSDDILFAQNMRAFRTLMRAGVQMRTTSGSTTLKPFAVLTTAAN